MASDPTIAYVLLRNAVFGPTGARSVELCVRDLVIHSRYARSTVVVCPPVDAPFEGIAIEPAPSSRFGNLGKAWATGRMLRARGADAIVVENHLPAAAVIAAASGLPVVLHSHAYEKAPRGVWKRLEREAEIRGIAGFAFVSEDCAKRFVMNFPRVADAAAAKAAVQTLPQSEFNDQQSEGPWMPAFAAMTKKPLVRVVPNGLDMRDWSAETPKDKSILIVGRALDDKGHLEAMGAIARALAIRPEWSVRFIMSATDQEPETVRALRAAAGPLGARVRIDENVPYADVKAAWARAAIGMVLTKSPEPFGRTALEALASGAALITSGLGGLAEVCGPEALIVDPCDGDAVLAALASLIDSPERRGDLARGGRARVEALYDIRAVASRMDDAVDAVCR